ncbi:nuclear receptor corepressor 2-like [Penaeus chinensis]|uniref:nuclear receptor corepressor 2-like n=1 Tax=Penaeus chinensis TaxID=139456 RepID=UPI001FB7F880|nr:nuclear receptor corepressor 2-like [Penaeus chinensis]
METEGEMTAAELLWIVWRRGIWRLDFHDVFKLSRLPAVVQARVSLARGQARSRRAVVSRNTVSLTSKSCRYHTAPCGPKTAHNTKHNERREHGMNSTRPPPLPRDLSSLVEVGRMLRPRPHLRLCWGSIIGLDSLTSFLRACDATYSFGYTVDAPEAENFYAHEEARQGEVTRGRFRVALPDNRLQTVTYRANRDGYTAEVSYANHPSFPALRASVGPIGDAPQIGASVVSGLRRDENWKDRKVQQRPDHGPRRPVGPSATNALPPIRTPTTTRPRRPSPKVPRPRPTATRAPTSAPSRRPSAAPTSPPAPTKPTLPPRPAPVTSRPSSRRPQPPPAAALFVAAEDLEDEAILSRLIEAIKLKTEEEMAKEEEAEEHHEDDSGEKRGKPRYKIEDKASVRLRLDAIVHAAKF